MVPAAATTPSRPPSSAGQAVHGVGQRRGVGDVRDPDDRGVPELVGQPGEALGPPCHQPDPRTGGDGGPRRGLADARRRARHHDPPAVQGTHGITVGRDAAGHAATLVDVVNVATNDRVGREELDAFLRTRHKAIVVTRRSDGGDQTSPVTLGIDAEGRLLVSTYPERAKVTNVRRDPRVAMCVLSDDFDGPWVHVEGTAEVLDLPDALEPLVEYFRSISGEHSDWDEYREAMARQGKSLIRLTVQRWGPIATGGFPARLAGS